MCVFDLTLMPGQVKNSLPGFLSEWETRTRQNPRPHGQRKRGEIKTVGEGGGGLRFLERAISSSVALLTAIEASVFLHSM